MGTCQKESPSPLALWTGPPHSIAGGISLSPSHLANPSGGVMWSNMQGSMRPESHIRQPLPMIHIRQPDNRQVLVERRNLRFAIHYPKLPVMRFAVWLDRDFALICDRSLPLEDGCVAACMENGFVWAAGTVTMKRPDTAKRVKMRMDEYWFSDSPLDAEDSSPVWRMPRENLVRVIGRYQALHEMGELPRGNGLDGVLTLPREMLQSDGTPIAAGRAVLMPKADARH
jgi:hypothetical protein